MINDLVSDALIRIKNGYMASKNEVILPYSKFILAILKVLQTEGFIKEFKEIESKRITVQLKYNDKKQPVLEEIKRISKPSMRVYNNKKSLPKVLNGFGIAIISTPKGVMTDKQARKEGTGGEVIAYVW